jgi:hypothetical protein
MNDHCTMPEHGRVDAPSPCCRPLVTSPVAPEALHQTPHRPKLSTAPAGIWARSAQNTLVCLLGCTIGDVGVVVASWIWFPHASMVLVMVLAIVAGLITSVALESCWRKRRGNGFKQAVIMALSMSFVSMVAMETAMNLVDLGLTGGNRAHLDVGTYLGILALGEVAGFLVPWPYNAWRLKHGRACH